MEQIEYWCFICEKKIESSQLAYFRNGSNGNQNQLEGFCKECSAPVEIIQQQSNPQQYSIYQEENFKNYEEAKSQFDKQNDQAKQFFVKQNYMEAIRVYQKANDTLQNIQEQQNKEKENIKLTEDQSKEIRENEIKILNNICLCNLRLGQYKDGELSATKVLKLENNNYKANFNRARCLVKLDRFTMAYQSLKICKAQNNNDPQIMQLIDVCRENVTNNIYFGYTGLKIGNKDEFKDSLKDLQEIKDEIIIDANEVFVLIEDPFPQKLRLRLKSKEGFSRKNIGMQLGKVLQQLKQQPQLVQNGMNFDSLRIRSLQYDFDQDLYKVKLQF